MDTQKTSDFRYDFLKNHVKKLSISLGIYFSIYFPDGKLFYSTDESINLSENAFEIVDATFYLSSKCYMVSKIHFEQEFKLIFGGVDTSSQSNVTHYPIKAPISKISFDTLCDFVLSRFEALHLLYSSLHQIDTSFKDFSEDIQAVDSNILFQKVAQSVLTLAKESINTAEFYSKLDEKLNITTVFCFDGEGKILFCKSDNIQFVSASNIPNEKFTFLTSEDKMLKKINCEVAKLIRVTSNFFICLASENSDAYINNSSEKYINELLEIIYYAAMWLNDENKNKRELNNFLNKLDMLEIPVFVNSYRERKILYANKAFEKVFSEGQSVIGKFCYQVIFNNQNFPCSDCLRKGMNDFNSCNEKDLVFKSKTFTSVSFLTNWTDGKTVQISYLLNKSSILEQQVVMNDHTYFDPMLSIGNLNKFEKDLNKVLESSENVSGALISIWMDGFKYINNLYGYNFGDRLMYVFIKNLESVVGKTMYRIGSDRFVVLLPNIDLSSLREVVANLIVNQNEILNVGGKQIGCHASIGVVQFPKDGFTQSQLMRSIDMATKKAKNLGKGSAVFFNTPDFNDLSVKYPVQLLKAFKQEILSGLENVKLYYRLVMDNKKNKLEGLRATLRWNYLPNKYYTTQDLFSMSEHIGLERVFGDWFLEKSMSETRSICEKYKTFFGLSLMSRQIQSDDFFGFFIGLAEKLNFPFENIVVIISENLLNYDLNRKSTQVEKIIAKGVKICVGDFGSGYTSPKNLKNVDWYSVQIEDRYVDEMLNDPFVCTFVKTRCQLAQVAGFRTFAKGVNSQEQREYLSAFGCDYIEGDYVSDALSIYDVKKYLEGDL